MNRLSTAKRADIVRCLVEGNRINAICRMTGAAKMTVLKLLRDLGNATRAYQDEALRDLSCQRIQADEIWAFVYAKAKNVPEDKRGVFGYGDASTWTALCADTKLMVSWLVGERSAEAARDFMVDLASRLTFRPQITTDANVSYADAIDAAFGSDVDDAQMLKQYGTQGSEDGSPTARRYSPDAVTSVETRVVAGDPDPDHISTSHVERSNLTMRMDMRGFTRLTNGFSKKVENLGYAVSIHFMYYKIRSAP